MNLAARLEALGVRRIHLCPTCGAATRFELEPCGLTEIKGVGLQETWFLVGLRRREASSS